MIERQAVTSRFLEAGRVPRYYYSPKGITGARGTDCNFFPITTREWEYTARYLLNLLAKSHNFGLRHSTGTIQLHMLQPIMVRTFGRTGSTLLMQLLGTSDRLFFERVYPFEHRYLTYVHNMSRIAGSPTVDEAIWNNDIMFQGKSNTVGALPYGLIRSLDRKSLQQQTFVALWQAFSENIRKQTGLISGPGWYAEKAPEEVATMAVTHLNAKSIYLLRDPRDEMISIKSFNNKRGFNSFGWHDNDTDAIYATRLCENRRKFLQKLIDSETTSKEIHVRYEDLILKGKQEAARLTEWLGTSLNIKAAMKDKSVISRHMTSRNPESSVARWKNEMDDDIQAIFRKQLGTELQQLGYEL